ncbi:hypothetical protein EDC04DRAFT_2598114 [Pisolithus marmoratus]|nr:hypothetical protein EDC04DRAFT_2598114 [Pisolithus marmoratus]
MARFEDDEFYMKLVTFQVEDCLFRVPRHTLEAQSPVFNDMFAFPPPPGVDVEATMAHAARLSKGDHDGWIPVLKLSRMWQMEELHHAALSCLKYSAIWKSVVEKLALALEYEIQHWIVPAVNELARRPQPISVEDTQVLGLETTSKVATVRERLISESLCLTEGGKDAIAPFITRIFNLSSVLVVGRVSEADIPEEAVLQAVSESCPMVSLNMLIFYWEATPVIPMSSNAKNCAGLILQNLGIR